MSKYSELFLTTTDTVVGIGAPVSYNNAEAIYELKGRDKSKPLIIMVGSLDQARSFKEWDKKAEEFAKIYWPGSTTLVLSDQLALRIPNNDGLRSLLNELGPCYMTSANASGQKPLSLKKAKKFFQEIHHYYDFGKGSKKPSAIIRVSNGEVIR